MPETYGDYSLLAQRRAGQYWSGGRVAGQWAWSPQPDGTAQISWGDPAAWPPPNFEVFRADPATNWVYMLGYGSTAGEWLPQVVTRDEIGDAAGNNWTTLPVDPSRRQRYTRWTIPSAGYSLRTTGYLDWAGERVDFVHLQKWAPPRLVTNVYYSARRCIVQSEVWSDNFGNPGGPLVVKQDRDQYLATGLGMAFRIVDRLARWSADLRYSWAW